MKRTYLKANAKAALSGNYWTVFLACLVVSLLSGQSVSAFTFQLHLDIGTVENTIENIISIFLHDIMYGTQQAASYLTHSIVISAFTIMAIVCFVAWIVGSLFNILIANPFRIGFCRFRCSHAKGYTNLSLIFSGFRTRPANGILTLFLRDLYVFLWSLLFIIPGIIKSFSYMLTEYILADNPSISAPEAIQLSRQMMNGHKWEAFVLKLSFIGWYILGALCCGVGVLFVTPYYEATMTQFYLTLRAQQNKG